VLPRVVFQCDAFDIHPRDHRCQPIGQPLGSRAEEAHQGGDELHADQESIDGDADWEGQALDLTIGSLVRTNPAKTEIMMSAAAVTTRDSRPRPFCTASSADAGDEKHLVVDRRAEEDPDDEDGEQAARPPWTKHPLRLAGRALHRMSSRRREVR
jgi:hypothetical protein